MRACQEAILDTPSTLLYVPPNIGCKVWIFYNVCNAWRGTPCAFATALCHDFSCNEPSHGLLWRCVATKALWCRYVQSEVMNIGVSFSAFVKPQRS